MSLFTRQVPFCVGHRGMESGVPGWIRTSSLRLRKAVCSFLHLGNKMAAGAGIAPACAAFQTAAHLSEPSSESYQTRRSLKETAEKNIPS